MEKRYVILEKAMCKELELLEEKYRNGQEMNEGDIRRADLLAHALKSLATYSAMKQAEGSDNNFYAQRPTGNSMGNSYMNSMSNNMGGMSAMNNMGNMGGMSNMGASYGMRGGSMDMSGHYPMNYPMYPEERRW